MFTDHYLESDVESKMEKNNPSRANTCSKKYDLLHNPKPNCNDDYTNWIPNLTKYDLRIAYVHFMGILKKCYGTILEQLVTYPQTPVCCLKQKQVIDD